MRFVLAAAVALAAITAAFALPAGARMTAPGPQCGGTLWKQMTLSDTGKSAVHWTPAATTVPDIGKLTAPKKIGTTRSTAFQKQVWHVTAVIQSFRMASNGELVLQLFDVPSSTYMNAYLPSSACLASTARGRAQMIATRNGFLQQCGAASNTWTPLGATADLTGVGFWNSVKTTAGAAKNGAELRPVLSVNITQGCGKF